MIALEVVCVAIVALYVVMRARSGELSLGSLTGSLGLIATAAWIGEDTMIRAYGFYQYSPRWHLFLDRVPLLIILIWPAVIQSAWFLARRLTRPRWVPLLTAGFVLADASLIEPIAVRAGLWSWNEPGLFHVPPIGVLGWSYFTFVYVTIAEKRGEWSTPILAPLGTHALLVATWWAALRWVNLPIFAWPVVVALWLGLGALALFVWRRRLREIVPSAELAVRFPAAMFFFVLLGVYGRDDRALVAYALAFAPPYFALWQIGGRRLATSVERSNA